MYIICYVVIYLIYTTKAWIADFRLDSVCDCDLTRLFVISDYPEAASTAGQPQPEEGGTDYTYSYYTDTTYPSYTTYTTGGPSGAGGVGGGGGGGGLYI